jgi:hypothetical protein
MQRVRSPLTRTCAQELLSHSGKAKSPIHSPMLIKDKFMHTRTEFLVDFFLSFMSVVCVFICGCSVIYWIFGLVSWHYLRVRLQANLHTHTHTQGIYPESKALQSTVVRSPTQASCTLQFSAFFFITSVFPLHFSVFLQNIYMYVIHVCIYIYICIIYIYTYMYVYIYIDIYRYIHTHTHTHTHTHSSPAFFCIQFSCILLHHFCISTALFSVSAEYIYNTCMLLYI